MFYCFIIKIYSENLPDMKIVSASELSEQLRTHDQDVIDLDGTLFRGNLTISRPCCLRFRFTDQSESSSSSFGNLTIQAPGVTIEGLRLTGLVEVVESINDLELVECLIAGSVRINSSCDRICFTNCVISTHGGMVGISVSDSSSVTVNECHIDGCITGCALIQHAIMGDGASASPIKWPNVSFKDCVFARNSVDILVDIYVHGGEPDATTASIPLDSFISLSGNMNVTINVSVRGVFDKPLQFTEWPIPRTSFPLTVPRRGSNASGRQCHLQFDADNLVISQDLPNSNVPTPRGRKRKQADAQPQSKAALYYYRILELEAGASKSDILSSYRRLALRYHPDKSESDGDRFILIKRARDELIRMIDD